MREADDYASLRSLGATRHQLTAVVMARATVIGIAGGLLAFVIAVLASPLMPFGLARQAEIHPGFNVNPVVLVPGLSCHRLADRRLHDVPGLACEPAFPRHGTRRR